MTIVITLFFSNNEKSVNYSKANNILLYNQPYNPESQRRTFWSCSSHAAGLAVMGQEGRGV